MIANETAVMTYMIHVSPTKWVSCAVKIKMAKEFTKPVMTGFGMNFINFPIFKTPSKICSKPVNIVAASK